MLFYFIFVDNKVPGPQKYDSKTLINGTGLLFNSKFASSPGKTISGRNKLVTNKLKGNYTFLFYFILFLVPGPGAYTLFSEFGQYKSKYADESASASENK